MQSGMVQKNSEYEQQHAAQTLSSSLLIASAMVRKVNYCKMMKVLLVAILYNR